MDIIGNPEVNSSREEYCKYVSTLMEQSTALLFNAIELEIKDLDLHISQLRILGLLTAVGDKGATVEQLSVWTIKKFNSVSVLIKNMEEKGLVKREKASGKSKSVITLTEKGADLYSNQVTTKSTEMIFDCLSDEELHDFESMLVRLRESARSLLGMDYKPPFLK